MSSTPSTPALTSGPGGVPTTTLDFPICIVLIVLYAANATMHMRRFRQSTQQFILSALTFGFCMSRIVTWSMRSVWAFHQSNKGVIIAANIFLGAGIILLFAVNMQLSFRLYKALHPSAHGNKIKSLMLATQLSLVVLLVLTVVPGVQSFLTTNPNTFAIDSTFRKFSIIYLTVYSGLPVFFTLFVVLTVPREQKSITRHVYRKAIVIIIASALLALEMGVRTAQTFNKPGQHPWFMSKEAFYLLIPLPELIVLALYALMDLPHLFGDSNAAVLRAINADDHKAIHTALQSSSPNYIQNHHSQLNSDIEQASEYSKEKS